MSKLFHESLWTRTSLHPSIHSFIHTSIGLFLYPLILLISYSSNQLVFYISQHLKCFLFGTIWKSSGYLIWRSTVIPHPGLYGSHLTHFSGELLLGLDGQAARNLTVEKVLFLTYSRVLYFIPFTLLSSTLFISTLMYSPFCTRKSFISFTPHYSALLYSTLLYSTLLH